MSSISSSSADAATTRGRITAHLRRGASSVPEIADAVGTTANAVRSHLSALERDGLVRNAGVRRSGGAGKPATMYELTAEAELSFSRAYPAVLTAVIETLLARLDGPQAGAVLREVGGRLAETMGGEAAGSLRERVQAAAATLNELGGDVVVESDEHGWVIRGHGCPLAQSVSAHPETCRAVRSMVQRVAGAPTEERCEHGDRPQCRFRVGAGR